MTDQEKEKAYQTAVGFLSSSLTNSENIEESLAILKELGDYKDADVLYKKYAAFYARQAEEKAFLDKRLRVKRGLQWGATVLGLIIAVALILLVVYGLRNPPWR